VIEVDARDWPTFLIAFGAARNAGLDVTPTGGNRMRLPDGTDPAVLSSLAGIDGVTVWTDQPAAPPEPAPEPVAEPPAAPAKTTKRRTSAR
jgi:hypothetical protein